MITCLFVPLFPLAARLRSEPELKEEAVAIFEGNGNAARVVAADSAHALWRGAGVAPRLLTGMGARLTLQKDARARSGISEPLGLSTFAKAPLSLPSPPSAGGRGDFLRLPLPAGEGHRKRLLAISVSH